MSFFEVHIFCYFAVLQEARRDGWVASLVRSFHSPSTTSPTGFLFFHLWMFFPQVGKQLVEKLIQARDSFTLASDHQEVKEPVTLSYSQSA